MEEWRKPAVLENTSTFSRAGASTVTVPVIVPAWTEQRNVYVPGSSNVNSTGGPFVSMGLASVQLGLEDSTLCGAFASSNSHRTVSPAGIVTADGRHVVSFAPSASITVVAADA